MSGRTKNISPFKSESEKESEKMELDPNPKTGIGSFFGGIINRAILGKDYMETQKKNWDTITNTARRLKENPSSYMAPKDPEWMQVHGGAYGKYILNLSEKNGEGIQQAFNAETFNDTVNIIGEEAKKATEFASLNLKWAVAGFIAFGIISLIGLFR